MRLIDSHAHLQADAFRSDADLVLGAARLAGVERLLVPGWDLPSSRDSVELAERWPRVDASAGIHPHAASTADEDMWAEIVALAADPRVVAVGETGLDYFRTGADGIAAQRRSFAAHIELARKHDKTLVIHDRDAHDDILMMLDAHGVPERTVLHCFSGDADFARRCLDRGAYLSFAGTVTFKNAHDIRRALSIAPLDKILVETDAPFLTPMPFRGRPNASYLIPTTVRAMADVLAVRNVSLEELCTAIGANTDAAFGGSWGR